MTEKDEKGKHTPGPWTAEKAVGPEFYWSSHEEYRASIYADVHGNEPGIAHIPDMSHILTDAEIEANIRLLTAAPDLLAALQEVNGFWANDWETAQRVHRKFPTIQALATEQMRILALVQSAIALAEEGRK